eukprot:gene20260-27760_t
MPPAELTERGAAHWGAPLMNAQDAPLAPPALPRAPSRWLPRSWISALALLVTAFTLVPLGFIAYVAWKSGWATAVQLIFRPRVGELVVNTALLVGLTVPLCGALAVALAWLTERSDLPGARTWAWLAAAPLAVPAFVHSYAWISLVPW